MSDQGRAVRHEALEAIVLLLNPITPHISHALWQALGHAKRCWKTCRSRRPIRPRWCAMR
jgi:leucyl-tRNA synthetase